MRSTVAPLGACPEARDEHSRSECDLRCAPAGACRRRAMTAAFIVAGTCLLLEMFFAASEISVISCDRIALRKGVAEGLRSARLLEAFLTNKQRLLATTLVGTQLSVVVSTVAMSFALHRHAPHRAALYLLLGLTPTIVVLGEIVPKTLGQQAADKMARRV